MAVGKLIYESVSSFV